MADRYWIASSAENWNSTACSGGTCWSTTSGGSGGASIPGTQDRALFNSSGTGDCTVTAERTVEELDMSGYTGTLTVNTGTSLIVGSGDTASIDIDSSATITLVGSTSYIIARCDITQLAASFSGSGKLIYQGNGNSSTNTFTGGTVNMPVRFGSNYTPVTVEFGNTTFKKDFTSSGTGTWTVDNTTNNPNLTFEGDVEIATLLLTWTKGTGTITLSGSVAQSIDFDGETVEDITVDKTSGTVTMTGAVTTDSLEITRGTWDANSQAIDVSGGVTSNPTAGAVTIQDTGTTGTLSITGNIDLNGTATYGITWNDLDIDALAFGTNVADYTDVTNSANSSGITITVNNGSVTTSTGWEEAGGAPTLSLPTYSNVQTNSATVGCTVTF
jgi:hypothetical protein